MSKKVQRLTLAPPLLTDAKSLADYSSVLQQNLEELFEEAHDHSVLTAEPSVADGSVGDIVLVKLESGLFYLYMKFNEGWKKIAAIDATGLVWDDARVPGHSAQLGASPPDVVTFGPSGNLMVLAFDGSVTMEQIYFQIQMPHSYSEGTSIYPHVHWTPTDAGTGTVGWHLEYTWANVNDVFPAPTTLSLTDNAPGVAWKSMVKGFGAIAGIGKKISSMIVGRLYRDPTTDTYGSDAAFLEFDVHFQIDADGSTQQFIK